MTLFVVTVESGHTDRHGHMDILLKPMPMKTT